MELNDFNNLNGGIGLDYLQPQPQPQPQPTRTPVQPTRTPVQPTRTPVQPTRTTVQPTRTTVQPTRTTVQPTRTTVQPTRTTVQPTRTRRPNVLERIEATIEPQVIERKTPTIRNVARDDTTLQTKMQLGKPIAPKKSRRAPKRIVDERPWDDIINYQELTNSRVDGGYSVKDLRALIGKTGLMSLDRSLWDRFTLMDILAQWLLTHGHYTSIKNTFPNLGPSEYRSTIIPKLQILLLESYNDDSLVEIDFTSSRSLESIQDDIDEHFERYPDVDRNYYSNDVNDNVNVIGLNMSRTSPNVDWINTTYGNPARTKCILRRFDSFDKCDGSLYNLIVLDHILDHVEDPELLINQSLSRLANKGILIIVAYSYGFNALHSSMKNIDIAYHALNNKLYIDYYVTPTTPLFDINNIHVDYPDKYQLAHWTRQLRPLYELPITDNDDPIREVVYIYRKP